VPGTSTRPVTVRTATRPGGHASADRLYVLPHAVVVLDGASEAGRSPRDGAWFAEVLGQELKRLLAAEPRANLAKTLSRAIAAVAGEHRLIRGHSPSSTVAVARWNQDEIDILTLGDSAIVAFTTEGQAQILSDTRLADIGRGLRADYRARLRGGSGFDDGHQRILRALQDVERQHRNSTGGDWIAEADPRAADQALVAAWPRVGLDALVLATDGVTRGIDLYRTPTSWQELLRAATTAGPMSVLDGIHAAEDRDAAGQRWPRSKAHDDKALAVVTFQRAHARTAANRTWTH
jgi:serine/threonine protein phosphatase PrpC